MEHFDPEIHIYSKRVWLNPSHSGFTGSVVTFHGRTSWQNTKGKPEKSMFLEVADCHQKAVLHKEKTGTTEDFIRKLKTLETEVHNFIEFLEEEYPAQAA